MKYSKEGRKDYASTIMSSIVTPPKLASANPVESLANHPVKPTCDQMGNYPCKNVRVDVKGGEQIRATDRCQILYI
jgi:hypothetical protein